MQTGQKCVEAEAAEAAEACLAAGLQLAHGMSSTLSNLSTEPAVRERHSQLLFDFLTMRAISAWTLKQQVPHRSWPLDSQSYTLPCLCIRKSPELCTAGERWQILHNIQFCECPGTPLYTDPSSSVDGADMKSKKTHATILLQSV